LLGLNPLLELEKLPLAGWKKEPAEGVLTVVVAGLFAGEWEEGEGAVFLLSEE